MAEQLAWMENQPQLGGLGLSIEADTEAYAGHLRKARELTRRAVDASLRADSKEDAAMWWFNAALREAWFGNTMEAREAAGEALKLQPTNQGVKLETALALAMVGDTVRAESLEQDLAKHFPLDTQVQSLWLPTLDARLALVRKNPAAAIDRLQAAAPMELGYVPFETNISCLYAVEVRGEAVLDDAAVVQNLLKLACRRVTVAHREICGMFRAQPRNSRDTPDAGLSLPVRDRARIGFQ
jgi:eukaryotic-like serine/threonine-protein kinase